MFIEFQVLDFDEFLQFYELLVERPEISQIYQEYANSDGNMDAQSLLNFFAKLDFELVIIFMKH